MPLFPLQEEFGGEHVEDVVAHLIVGHQQPLCASTDGGIDPVPVVIGAVGGGEEVPLRLQTRQEVPAFLLLSDIVLGALGVKDD